MKEQDFIAAMQQGIPPIEPPAGLEVINHNNEGIEAIAASVELAEAQGQLPHMRYAALIGAQAGDA